jgi:hypothetical protein
MELSYRLSGLTHQSSSLDAARATGGAWRAGNCVFFLVELSLKVVPRNEVEGSICQLGMDSIKLIQVSHGSFVAVAMMVSLIRTATIMFMRSLI